MRPELAAISFLAMMAVGCRATRSGSAPDAESAASSTPAPVELRHLRLAEAPPAGDVASIAAAALAEAKRERRRLLVYVGASWCEPCRRFHDAAARGDLDESFGDLTLLEFDLDRDGERLAAAAYTARYIPLFALPASDGTSSGKQVEGAIKGEGAVAYLVPRLKELLAE
jgi:hypothetical protein